MGSKFSNDRHGAWGSKAYWGSFDSYGKPCKKEGGHKSSAHSEGNKGADLTSCEDNSGSSSANLPASDDFCCSDNIFSRLEEIYTGKHLNDSSNASGSFSLDSFSRVCALPYSGKKRRLALKLGCIREKLFFFNPLFADDDEPGSDGYDNDCFPDRSCDDLTNLLSLSPVDISGNRTDKNPYVAQSGENPSGIRKSTRENVRRSGTVLPGKRQSVRRMRKAVRERRSLELKMQSIREKLIDVEKSVSAKGIKKASRILRRLSRSVSCEVSVRRLKIHYGKLDVYFVPGKIVSHYRKHSKLLRTSVKMLRDRRKFFEFKSKSLNDTGESGGGAGGNVVTKSNQPLMPRDR